MRRGAKLDIEIERGTAEYSPRNSYISGIVRKNYCEVCGAKDKKLEVHHIVPVYLGKHIGWLGRRLRADENLVTLCHKCHSKQKHRYNWFQLPLQLKLPKLPRSG